MGVAGSVAGCEGRGGGVEDVDNARRASDDCGEDIRRREER